MLTMEDYKESVTAIYKKFYAHYGKLFLAYSNNDRAKHAFEWISVICSAQLPIERLESYTTFVIENSNVFRKFPPTSSQYAAGFNEWAIQNPTNITKLSDDEFKPAFEKFYLDMGLRYEGLWGKSETASVDAHKEYWKSELHKENMSIQFLRSASKRIREITKFKVYPPNIDQFIELARIIQFDQTIPLIEDAYDLAIANKDSSKLHPLIKYTRSKFGYINLLDRRNNSAKSRFEDEYRITTKMYIDGQLDLSQINQVEVNPGVGTGMQPCEKETLIDTLDRILIRVREK
jgi:hypothetical protein